ncbi:MAG: LON peptidase substrate-binding domain-containing protein [Planctomycetaceae bacterium]
MSPQFEISNPLASFSGRSPLFPLPEAVLLPHVLVPLHIFEPRYREMTADALNGEGVIATARLQATSTDSVVCPTISQTVCLGRIAGWKRLTDGRYYILLQGVARAQIIREISDNQSLYRVAELRLLADDESNLTPEIQDNLRHDLMSVYQDVCPQIEVNQLFQTAYTSAVSLGALCDVLAHSLAGPPGWTQQILEQSDVKRRAELLLERLQDGPPADDDRSTSGFPPSFSSN